MQKRIYFLLLLCIGLSVQAIAAHESCGDPPPTQFLSQNDEKLKGELKGKAELLTRFVGNAALGGQIELYRNQIYSAYPDADKARTNAYFLYMFCVVVLDPKNTQTTEEKLNAIKEFERQLQRGSSTFGQPTESLAHPVLVTPNDLDIVSGYRQRRTGFWVYNTRNQPYYDIWIQVSLALVDIDWESVSIVEYEPAVHSYSFLKDGDYLPIGACGTDSSGNKAIWIILWELSPNGRREYIVELEKGVTLTESSRLKANVRVTHVGDSPIASVDVVNSRTDVSWVNRAHGSDQIMIGFKNVIPQHYLLGLPPSKRETIGKEYVYNCSEKK